MNKSIKIADIECRVLKNGSYVEVPDITKFTTPDIEANDAEVKGAGIIGTLNVPCFDDINAMEASVVASSHCENFDEMQNPAGCKIKLCYSISFYSSDLKEVDYTAYTAYLTVVPKKIPGGDKEQGSTEELEQSYSVMSYTLYKNGVLWHDIDQTNGKMVVAMHNYMSKLNAARQRY